MSKRITLKRQMELLEDYAKRLNLATDNQTMSAAMGISISVLHDMRSGVTNDPRIETMKKIADYYQIDLNYFELETEGACTTYLSVREARLKGTKVEIDDKAVVPREEGGAEVLEAAQVDVLGNRNGGHTRGVVETRHHDADPDAGAEEVAFEGLAHGALLARRGHEPLGSRCPSFSRLVFK